MLEFCNRVLWGWLLPVLLCAAALYCGHCSGWRPLSCFGSTIRETYGSLLRRSDRKQKRIFAAALAATMGTGNLAGTALALMAGGAGALFWMWVSALLGMLLVYAENRLSIRIRRTLPDGRVLGGALGYLTAGMKSCVPAYIFAVCCTCSALGMGCMVQSATLADTAAGLGAPPTVTALLTAGLLLYVLRGGSRTVREAAAALMPLLCVGYMAGCLAVVATHAAALPGVLTEIFREAFGFRAMGGGFAGAVFLQSMSIGLRRGIFSNEAGLGSSGLLHMETDSDDPDLQGKWAAAEVFADTVLCCTATALAILVTPDWRRHTDSAAGLLLHSFASGLGAGAEWFLASCMILLAFATMIGWYPCGLAAFRFLFGMRWNGCFLAAYILAAFAGALGDPSWLWAFCDCCNGLMALPNLYGMLHHLREEQKNKS